MILFEFSSSIKVIIRGLLDTLYLDTAEDSLNLLEWYRYRFVKITVDY